MFKRLIVTLIILAHSSCMTRKPKSGFEDIADFGLSDDGSGVKVDDKAYFDDLKRSEASVSFESSLPLPFRVGKSGDSFDTIPSLAKPSLESRLIVSVGPCTFTLLSGPVQVDRYLLAGQWIKLTEGLPAKTPVKLEPNQDLNIKAVSKLGVELSESMVPRCKRLFEGRKFFIGRFHLNKSRLGLVPGPGSPNISFGAKSLDPQGKMVFLHWQNGSNLPTIIDDFDFPATAESGIFRAQMAAKGYYYLAFQTVLRMDQVDSMVIKLPFHGPIPPPAPAANPAPAPAAQAAAKALPAAVGSPKAPGRHPVPVPAKATTLRKTQTPPARGVPHKPGAPVKTVPASSTKAVVPSAAKPQVLPAKKPLPPKAKK